jgi:hypothetical protein
VLVFSSSERGSSTNPVAQFADAVLLVANGRRRTWTEIREEAATELRTVEGDLVERLAAAVRGPVEISIRDGRGTTAAGTGIDWLRAQVSTGRRSSSFRTLFPPANYSGPTICGNGNRLLGKVRLVSARVRAAAIVDRGSCRSPDGGRDQAHCKASGSPASEVTRPSSGWGNLRRTSYV